MIGLHTPPHSVEIEQAILGTILLGAPGAIEIIATTDPEHFYMPVHQAIFRAMRAMTETNEPIDAVTVMAHIRASGKTYQGIAATLVELMNSTPSISNIERHCEIMRGYWLQREVCRVARDIAAKAYEPTDDAHAFIEWAEQSVYELCNARKRDDGCKPIGAWIKLSLDAMCNMAKRGNCITGMSTGFAALDEQLSGLHAGDLTVLAARPGMGKAHPLSTKVLTPLGWRAIGDMVTGDEVIGSDGKPTRVLAVHDRGVLPIYLVTFDDGGRVHCCNDHLWTTQTRRERKGNRNGSARPVSEIRDTLRVNGDNRLNHSIKYVDPVQFEQVGTMPLRPYLLGCLLGDGSLTRAVGITSPDPELAQRCAELLPASDKLVQQVGHKYQYRIRRKQRNNAQSDTATALDELELRGLHSERKFVPLSYLMASVDDRLELLRGLLDTDGYVTDPHGSCIEFCTASPRLRDDVMFLVGSLGGRVTCSSKLPSFTSADGTKKTGQRAYRVIISFRNDIVPLWLPRKLQKYRTKKKRALPRFVESIEEAGESECRCISVEAEDHLYVTEDFLVTHNSALAMQIGVNVAANEKEPHGVVLFSLEMPGQSVGQRTVCSEADVSLSRYRGGAVTSQDYDKLFPAAHAVWPTPMWVDEASSVTLLDIRSRVRRLQAQREIGVVIIDYIQLMEGAKKANNREQEIASISRGLKILAKEMGVAVVALSQLNRAVETRSVKDKRPQLSDLRESGAIEQDADNVLFIYREDYYAPPGEPKTNIAEVIVAKQRNGPTGIVKLGWEDHCTRFTNMKPETY